MTRNNFIIIIFTLLYFSSYASTPQEKPKDTMNMGRCFYMDYFIYYCKPFSCAMNVPFNPPSLTMTKHMAIKGMKDGKCYYNTKIIIKKGTEPNPFEVIEKCTLSKEGLAALLKEFNIYKAGDASIFQQGSNDPILRKECKIVDEE